MTNNPLDSIRAILLSPEQERLRELSLELEALQRQAEARLANLQAELDNARDADSLATERLSALQIEIDEVRRVVNDYDALIQKIKPAISELLSHAIHESKDEVAEALGPVMGEAIRVQIRDSRKDMVEALYPIIGETVQKAIGEFTREFQRNIDARLKSAFRPANALDTMGAQLRGVSAAELALREAIPFTLNELFVIQQGSGLLLAHYSRSGQSATDSDLISGMLTAIRDFVRDSFGKEQTELEEVDYGEQNILLEHGRAAYVAAVIAGVEPLGFRARLRQFVSDLHVKHEAQLRAYNGDPASLPPLQPKLTRLGDEFAPTLANAAKPISSAQRNILTFGALGLLLCLGLTLFYGYFTYKLWPVAFPPPSATPTATATPSHTPTATFTPTATPTPTNTPTATFTATPLNTPTATFTPSATPTSLAAQTIGNVWARNDPNFDLPQIIAIEINTALTVRAAFGEWLQVEWQTPDGAQVGWVPARWVQLQAPVPAAFITPAP
ncbi:MAG: hypothetical protein JNL09_01375 [Anaerolineales bacterium]|nr:hypothetical protein [Anaerolineales bacterium]